MYRIKNKKLRKRGDLTSSQHQSEQLALLIKEQGITPQDLAKFYQIKRLFEQTVEIHPEDAAPFEKKGVDIPVSIFSGELSGLETVVKYLIENKGLRHREIALYLKRSEKTTYQAYKFARKKFSGKFIVTSLTPSFPLKILAQRNLGVLESIAKFLHENNKLGFSEIARLLHRDPRTIWTAYKRAQEKAMERYGKRA